MSTNPDPVTFLTNFAAEIVLAVNAWAVAHSQPNWLPTGSIYLTTPPDPYPQGAPKPFGVLRVPRHSVSNTVLSQTTGNAQGKPNLYTLYYYEAAYQAASTRATEELRCLNTYAAVGSYFKPIDGSEFCLPDTTTTIEEVDLRQTPSGPFIPYGSQIWIGIAIDFLMTEEYS